jgi:hypothetical protein
LWKFEHLPKYSSKGGTYLQDYINYLTKKLQITKLEDWYRISREQIEMQGGSSIIYNQGGLSSVLKLLYPNHNWKPELFASIRGKKASQRWLSLRVKDLFPSMEILEDYLILDLQGNKVEIDVYIPSLKLGFEYQGEQHYHNIYLFGQKEVFE